MLYIFDKDDNFLNIITEDTGLIDTWFKDYQNHLIDEPFVFHVDSESELLPLIVAENQVAFKHEFHAMQQDIGTFKLMRIKEVDELYDTDGYIVKVTCEPAWLELYDHFIEDRRIDNGTANTAMTRALNGSRWVGQVVGEGFGDGSTNFYWIDAVEALFKIADEWGGILQDYIYLDDNNEIVLRVMYLFPRLGRDNGLLIQPGYNAETIERRTLSYPVTAMWGQGASLEIEDDEGQHTGGYTRYITFEDVEWSKAKGDPVDKPKGQKWVGDPQALARYGYLVDESEPKDVLPRDLSLWDQYPDGYGTRISENLLGEKFVVVNDRSTPIYINTIHGAEGSTQYNIAPRTEQEFITNGDINILISGNDIFEGVQLISYLKERLHRFGHFSNQDYETPEELLYATWEALQEEKDPEIYHEAVIDEVDKPIFLGDTGTILDRHYGKPIEVQSQITGLEYDILRPTENVKTVLGNYKDMSRDPLEDEIDEIKNNQKKPQIIGSGNFPNKKPMKPINVKAVGGWETIQVTWTYSDEIYVSHYEVYASQNKDFVPDSQFLVYNGKVSAFGHEVKTDEVWYYRVCAVNYQGVKSEYSDEATASTIRIPLDATNFESIVTDAKNKADEAYDNAVIATGNATQAIQDAQTAFDKSLEAIDGLTTLNEFVDEQTGEITRIKGDVQGLQTSVSNKVDESTFSTFVQQTNNSLAGKISMTDAEGVFVKETTFSATVDGLQTTVNNKADKSTVTQLAGVVDTKISTVDANNKFATQSQLTQTSTSLTSTITSVRNDLDELEIGGRNLAKGTSDEFQQVTMNSWNHYHDGTTRYDAEVTPGEEYTASVYYRNVKDVDMTIRLFWTLEDGSRLESSNGSYVRVGEEGYATITRTAPNNAVGVKHVIRRNAGTGGGISSCEYKEVMLVKGNRATDWSPAPEDMATQSQISQLSDAINLRVKEGDLLSQINIEADRVLINTDGKLVLDAESTLISNAIIKNAHIESLSGEKLISKSIIADKLNVDDLSTITARLGTVTSGRMLSQNNNMDLNLNTGNLTMQRANFTLGSGAMISFTDVGNRVQFSELREGVTRYSGLGVGRGTSAYPYPIAYVGTSSLTGGVLDNTSKNWTGLTVHSQKSLTDGAYSSITSNKFMVRDSVSYSRALVFDLTGSTPKIITNNPTDYDYELGTFRRIYGKQTFGIVNYSNERSGWLMETNYAGDGTDITFRGTYGADYNYQIGSAATNNRIRNIYLRNAPNVSSDERLKEDIFDLELGLDFINKIDAKQFRLIPTNADSRQGTTKNKIQFGIIAQQVNSVLTDFGVSDNSLITQADDGYFGAQYEQFIPTLIKSTQELDTKINLTREELVLKMASLEERIIELESAA